MECVFTGTIPSIHSKPPPKLIADSWVLLGGQAPPYRCEINRRPVQSCQTSPEQPLFCSMFGGCGGPVFVQTTLP